ncbi:HAD family hydrolase [archaeon]|nr:HAD family hydrolase [archaeon]
MNILVLFDIDKTLLRSKLTSTTHAKAFSYGIKQSFGIEVEFTYKAIHPLPGLTDQQIIKHLLEQESVELTENKIKECMKHMEKYYITNMQKGELEALPGTKKLLEQLKQKNVTLGLVTGNIEAIGWKKLEDVHLKHYFSFGGFGSDAADRAELVRIALKKSGYQGNNVFLFGDTPRDITAGKENNVKTIGVATGPYTIKELKDSGANLALETLENTEQILSFLNS